MQESEPKPTEEKEGEVKLWNTKLHLVTFLIIFSLSTIIIVDCGANPWKYRGYAHSFRRYVLGLTTKSSGSCDELAAKAGNEARKKCKAICGRNNLCWARCVLKKMKEANENKPSHCK